MRVLHPPSRSAGAAPDGQRDPHYDQNLQKGLRDPGQEVERPQILPREEVLARGLDPAEQASAPIFNEFVENILRDIVRGGVLRAGLAPAEELRLIHRSFPPRREREPESSDRDRRAGRYEASRMRPEDYQKPANFLLEASGSRF